MLTITANASFCSLAKIARSIRAISFKPLGAVWSRIEAENAGLSWVSKLNFDKRFAEVLVN